MITLGLPEGPRERGDSLSRDLSILLLTLLTQEVLGWAGGAAAGAVGWEEGEGRVGGVDEAGVGRTGGEAE